MHQGGGGGGGNRQGSVTTSAPATGASSKQNIANNPPTATAKTHWKGYAYILLASFINVMAISDIDTNADSTVLTATDYETDGSRSNPRRRHWGVALSFGMLIFLYSATILVTDGLGLVEQFPYHTARRGRVEGGVLCVVSLYATVAVAYLTQVGGVAYLALNVYFSAWLLPVTCLYTLNEWSKAHDILSVSELTGVSATLKSWYIVALASGTLRTTEYHAQRCRVGALERGLS
jgi:hypothetical protein